VVWVRDALQNIPNSEEPDETPTEYRNQVPQFLTNRKRRKKRDFRQPPPTTATFLGIVVVLEPTVLVVILPTGFWVNVLVGNSLGGEKYRRKG